jgi:hypothetical protein
MNINDFNNRIVNQSNIIRKKIINSINQSGKTKLAPSNTVEGKGGFETDYNYITNFSNKK